jgi:hypothetical protein
MNFFIFRIPIPFICFYINSHIIKFSPSLNLINGKGILNEIKSVKKIHFQNQKDVFYSFISVKELWVRIDNSVIEYRNDKTGRITAHDLADSTGTLMSKYKKYPANFYATKINVEFTSSHDKSFDIEK